jgi:hypothetical protein
MKTHRILCWCAAIALPPLALAEPSFTAQSVGTSQAAVDFCARIDSATAAKLMALMEQSASGDELAKARGTDEYKEAYTRTSATLGGLPESEGADACSRFLDADRQAAAAEAADQPAREEGQVATHAGKQPDTETVQ